LNISRAKRLAPFKLPERLEILDALPLVGESGKIDNKAMVKIITEKLKKEGTIK